VTGGAREPATLGFVTDTPTRTNAPTLSWAVRLLSLEAVALGGLVVFVIWKAIDGSAASTKTRIGIPIAVVLCVVIVAGLARALSHLKPWARGPAIVIEMLLIPIGYYMATGGLGYIGILVLMAGLFGAGLLLAPSTRTTLGIDRYSDR
jgi:hypothetical protein